MTIAGAAAAGTAIAALTLSARGVSSIERRLARISPRARRVARWRAVGERDLAQSDTGLDQRGLAVAKLLGALAGLVAGVAITAALSLSGAIALVPAYFGAIAPSLIVERRAAGRRHAAELASAPVIERLEALVAAGRPAESALATIAIRPTGSPLLDRVLGQAAERYALGAPLFRSLGAAAEAEGLAGVAAFAAMLERARDLGRGSLALIREARDERRASERAHAIEAASRVEGRLMLILVLCYLPALFLLVVIPLFIGLLDGLFGG
jgi:tight adherence protein C